jgi:transaldolase
MYDSGDGHVQVLAASIRHLDHLLAAFAYGADLVTVPAKALEEWASKKFPLPASDFSYKVTAADGRPLKPIPYRSLDVNEPWESFNIAHELTTKGIKKFVEDYQSTLKRIA